MLKLSVVIAPGKAAISSLKFQFSLAVFDRARLRKRLLNYASNVRFKKVGRYPRNIISSRSI